MKSCPHCAQPIEDGTICTHCGRDVIDDARLATLEKIASDQSPKLESNPPANAASGQQAADRSGEAAAVEAPPNPQGTRSRRWVLLTVALAAILAGAWAVLLIAWPPSNKPVSPAVRPPEEQPVATEQQRPNSRRMLDSTKVPKWVGRKRAVWARDGSKTISFELQADNDVPVWMTRLSPVLAVRCLSRHTEVFVVTGSTSIDPKVDGHPVRVQFDEGAETVQEWSPSTSSQELFAPDGVALARLLARARTMRFGFTPYNASPVVADFHVGGFDQLVGLVATTCGWRADHSSAQKKPQRGSNKQAASSAGKPSGRAEGRSGSLGDRKRAGSTTSGRKSPDRRTRRSPTAT